MNERERPLISRASAEPRILLSVFASATPFVFVFFIYRYVGAVMDGRSVSPLGELVNEATGVYLAALLFLPIIDLARALPLDRPGWPRRLPVHLAGVIAFGAAHTTLMWGSRALIYPLLGLGAYSYAPMPWRYLMEFPLQVVLYTLVVLLTHLYDRRRAERARELRVSRLETELAHARLAALRMQLNPHFLFNTLNTISSVMYEDVRAADAMLSRLSELLRRTLAASDAQEVPLARELDHLEVYLDIMRWRFQDLLDVRVDAGDELRRALVPSLVLQPLVENAIEHGAPEDRPLRLEVGARRIGDRLRVQVRDWGRGAPVRGEYRTGWGVGLTNTAARVQELYGADHTFEVVSLGADGFLVSLELPYREVDGEEPAPAPVDAAENAP